tara:strand:+ start:8267 stop:8740 length:474 start_codon:yes stop_codon:yes gene_type:complete
MAIWNNKSESSTTNWTNQDDSSTTSWTTDGGGISFGPSSPQSTSSGIFDSAASASASLIGGQFHLFDSIPFNLGTDKDFTFKYDHNNNGMNINGANVVTDSFFTITKGDNSTKLMSLSSSGDLDISGSFHIGESSELHQIAQNGDIVFYNNELYIHK